MTKINVYDFCTMMFQDKEITLHGWFIDENGNKKCVHKTYLDKFHNDFYSYWRNFEVTQFKVTKKGCIDIIATNI